MDVVWGLRAVAVFVLKRTFTYYKPFCLKAIPVKIYIGQKKKITQRRRQTQHRDELVSHFRILSAMAEGMK
jgi:hypothetical protein